MSPAVPVCCLPAAHRLMGRAVVDLRSPDALLAGAVAVAMHGTGGEADPAAVAAAVRGLTDAVRKRVHTPQPQAILAHLHDELFDVVGFAGAKDDYDEPRNSYISTVLDTKRGLPVLLALVYKCVAAPLGLDVWGVGLPGHFLVGVKAGDGGSPLLVDCYHGGQVVTAAEARERVVAQFDGEVDWSDTYLKPVTHRDWLTRVLQNLLNRYGTAENYTNVAAVIEMLMLLWPDRVHLQRDLGLILARCGKPRPARLWLGRYIANNPNDPQVDELQQLRDGL